jgi:phosphoribosylaminoimidazolecarboxamide formyltransferase/IMP cyclohydrolase
MPKENLRIVKRALLSVSDKNKIVEFARELIKYNIEIISTGGTARILRENGVAVREVADVTGFPEMMDGRVKTLHPKIHGGLLALRDNAAHTAAMSQHGIEPIDLLVVNLYPFEKTVSDAKISLREAIEQIDIGGPAMIRSAAKNFRDVAVVVDSNLYDVVLGELAENNGALSLTMRQMLCTLAFMRTSAYDAAIAEFLMQQNTPEDFSSEMRLAAMQASMNFTESFGDRHNEDFYLFDENENDKIEELAETNGHLNEDESKDEAFFPDEDELDLTKIVDLRYGENPHQRAALYSSELEIGGIAQAEQIGGKEMSFNNYVDADAAWNLVSEFDVLACAIIKHTNPSGVGLGASAEEAYRRALQTDPVSAFGGIVAFNSTVDAAAAQALTEIFTEVVVAPEYDAEALRILRAKKNLRVLRVAVESEIIDEIEFKQISGGFLAQEKDTRRLQPKDLQTVTIKKPSEAEVRALLFAWNVCKHVKSNAVVFANEQQTVGVGAGQMNRVDSVRIAAMRAARTDLTLRGTVLASDAFFPFRDGVDEAARHEITAIIQPGGSVRDDETIQAANEHGLAMIFTNIRHFKH